MANGPLGGFMPTPPSPGQPPQVKLETSAESRGAFNKFLGTLPSNGAIAPIQTGVDVSSTTPVSPVTSNVNIFQPQMSQMAPMPMMPPAQPVQNFFFGGAAMSGGGFSDAEIGSQIDSFDSGQQDSSDNFDDSPPDSDMDYTDIFKPDELQQATDIGVQTGGDDSPPPVIDTRPRTNIRNVGPTSNLRFDPQFTADLLSRRFGDDNISGFMSKDDFAQTRQGGATGQVSTSGLPSLSLGQNLLTAKPTVSRQDVLTAANRLSDVAPAASVPLAPTSPFFDRDLLDDPLGLGIRTGFGPAVDAIEEGRARARAFPSAGTPVAGLPTIVPGAGGTLPDADPLAGDVIGAIRSGAAGLPFTNNPGALKQGQPDLTTEVVKSLPTGSRLTQDNLAPAIFNTLDAGIKGIDRQLGLYANNPSANITTPEALANTYLGSGNKENSPANRAAYIDAIKAVAGESFDLNNPTTRSNISQAIVNQEFGQAGRDIMAEMRRGTDVSILDNLNLDQLRLNEPLRSNVNQLGTLDSIQPQVNLGIAPIGEQRPESRGEITSLNPFGRARPDLVTDREDDVLSEIAERNEDRARSIADRGFPVSVDEITGRPSIAPTVDNLLRLGQEAQQRRNLEKATTPDQALENLTDRRDIFQPDNITFDPITIEEDDLTTVSPNLISGLSREANLDDANTFRQTVPDVAKIFGGRQITTTPRGIDQELSPIVAAGIGAPEEFKQPFPDAGIKIGNFTIPTLTSGLNLISDFSRQRVFDAVLNKGATPVYDGNTLVGAKINGVLVEGMDPNAPMDSGDNQDPVTKFLRKATEDKKEKDKDDQPPNQIGDVVIRDPEPPKPTVVKSTAPASTASFTPVGFDAGNLNDLIARITGVPTPRRLQDGGQVQAVDRFLSKVA